MAQLSSNLPWAQANPLWAALLNPLLSSPLADAQVLTGINLVAGINVINHKLGKKLTGYIVVLSSAQSTFWDNQSTNPSAQTTLILNSSAVITVSILVF